MIGNEIKKFRWMDPGHKFYKSYYHYASVTNGDMMKKKKTLAAPPQNPQKKKDMVKVWFQINILRYAKNTNVLKNGGPKIPMHMLTVTVPKQALGNVQGLTQFFVNNMVRGGFKLTDPEVEQLKRVKTLDEMQWSSLVPLSDRR